MMPSGQSLFIFHGVPPRSHSDFDMRRHIARRRSDVTSTQMPILICAAHRVWPLHKSRVGGFCAGRRRDTACRVRCLRQEFSRSKCRCLARADNAIAPIVCHSEQSEESLPPVHAFRPSTRRNTYVSTTHVGRGYSYPAEPDFHFTKLEVKLWILTSFIKWRCLS